MRTTSTLELNLKQLNLKSFLDNYVEEAEYAIKAKSSYSSYLSALTELEVSRRFNSLVKTRLKEANFSTNKTLDTFNFSKISSIKKEIIFELAEGHFINSSKNVILFGSCGAGKTHIAIAIGRELCLKKHKVYFSNVCQFINQMQEANQQLALNKFFKKLEKFDLIILDELGYIPFEKQATDLLFQFLANQYERRSVMITTNLAFSQWDQIFKDKQTTVAAVDRLVHHSYVLHFQVDESYRLLEFTGTKKTKEKNKEKK
ncbi:AAA family ATPase [bacterium]|nr:AAA family ATPase [bacterium]